MKTSFTGKVAGILHFIGFALIVCAFPVKSYAQIGLRTPPPPKVVSLFEQEYYGLERIAVDSTLFDIKPRSFLRQVKMDSTEKFISVSESFDKTEILLPAVVDIATYARLRLHFEMRELWKAIVFSNFKTKEEKDFGAIRLDIPFRIRNKTFTRIFGSDRIGLKVTGNISFDLSGRTEERSGSAVSAVENQNTFSPRFKQTQQFTVEGHIGEKVTVSVEQNSEAVTDIENTLKLRYKGDEDEIVQAIEAGNIGLSLPSTKYVIFGGSNKGLFGLKTQMKLGNLHFTGIASLEKGQQQELSISGGASEATTKVKDTDFIKNRYFFVDKYYRDYFEYGLLDDPQRFRYIEGTDILQLEVWQSVSIADDNARYGIADVNPKKYLNGDGNYLGADPDAIDEIDGEIQRGYFKKLNESEYSFDRYRGFVSLRQTVATNTILAVSYVTSAIVSDSGFISVGTLEEQLTDTTSAVVLKLLKPRANQPTYTKTWPLMMRNVYSLGGSKIESDGFEVRLEHNVNGEEERYPRGSEQSFLNRTGLDVLNKNGEPEEGGDELVDINPVNLNLSEGTLIYPSLQPFNPDPAGPWDKTMPDDYKVDMYEISNSNTPAFLSAHKFDMIITSKSTKSTFGLGFYVLEGSEVVTMGGQTLVRDRDYLIDYFSGQLTLISPEAKRSSSNIEIKYERANLFQLDKKTIFGGRLEYRFWDGGFIGLTALYLNKSTLDQRVRVGQEPFENFVWDVNAAFKFKPRFLTKAIDALPLIETNAESQFNIEGEFAQIMPNPNSLNNPGTNDNNGVAYIDDFEASKRTMPLGIRRKIWTMASPPKVLPNLSEFEIDDPNEVDAARSSIVWFNPYHQVPIKEIWPNRDVNAQTGQTTDVLGIELRRREGQGPDSAWAGIMRSTVSFPDQQKTKYIEVWIKGTEGTAHIDIGRISEDWYLGESRTRSHGFVSGEGILNHEDFNNNGLLDIDLGEDSGVDGIPNPGGDPYDDWAEIKHDALPAFDDGIDYEGINGTERNSQSREARYPDTEDLDNDGQLTTTNAYFEYSFSLDTNDVEAKKWISGSTKDLNGITRWRQFRIPLKDYTRKIGEPDPNFQQIFYARLWFSDIPEERSRIFVATFDFVGNEWEEKGIAKSDTSAFVKEDSIFTIETFNDEENAEATEGREAYVSPPGVEGVRDRITNAVSKEQSLAMRFFGLPAGNIAEAKKTLYSSLDLSNYERLRMFVHGNRELPDQPPPAGPDSSKIRFYLRFGSDVNNYYEYGQDIYAGWHTSNNVDIDLDELSGIKFNDSLRVLTAEKSIYIKNLANKPGGYYKSVGKPSVKTIRYFIVGVKNRDFIPYEGEIWLDELRLSNVRKQSATALRLKASLKLADFISVNAQWESKDADFHNVSTQFGKGNTEERQNYSGKLNFDKLLPTALDLSIPIDARVSFSRNVPKYYPRSDKLTNYQNNTIENKISSLFGIRELPKELENQVSESKVYGIGTTIKKRSKSSFWLMRYTLDNLLLDLDYSYKKSNNWEIEYNRSKQIKESAKFKIPFDKDNYITPLKFAKGIPVLGLLADQKIWYTPNNINMAINISEAKTASLRRSFIDTVKNVEKTTNDIGSTRSLSSSYRMLNSLNFSYSRNHRADADFVGMTHKDLLEAIFTRGYFGKEVDIGQSFKGDFKPDLFSWLNGTFGYSSAFKYQLTNGYKYRSSNNSVQKKVSLTFKPGTLLKAIYTPDKKKSGSSRRGRSSKSSSTKDNKDTEKDKEQTKGGESIFPNPLLIIYDALASWQSIKATYTVDDKVSNKYLTNIPSWEYQFGFTQDPGIGQDSTLLDQNVNLVGPVVSNVQSLRTSTSINIAKNVKANFTHDYREQEGVQEYGKVRTGSRSRTYFVSGDNPQESMEDFYSDIRGFIPDWTVQISGVEKLPILSTFTKSISVDHGHSSKLTENLNMNVNTGEYLPNSQTFSNNWQPLVGVNISTNWGITAKARMTSTTSYSYRSAAGATKTESEALTFSLNYAISSGFKIPLPFWPFKGKTFKNEINFSLTFDSSTNKTFNKQFDSKKFEEKMATSNWKLRPSATYRFSSRVQGSFFYETSVSQNKISGEYSYNEFGINVNIAIRD